MKKNMLKTLSTLLCLLMILSMFPANIFASSNVITGFKEIKENYYFKQDQTLDDIEASLPDSIDVYLNGSEEATSINVSWECIEDFNNTNLFEYNFKPTWSSDYALSSDLNDSFDIPYLKVKSEEGKAIEESSSQKSVSAASNESLTYSYAKNTIGLNVAASCGILQNLYSESGIQPNNLENYYNSKLGYTDSEYTSKVNSGAYSEYKFVHDSAGYGIAQWTYYTRKQKLYNKTVDAGFSVGNLTKQLSLLNDELSGYTATWRTLKSVPNTDIGAFLAAAAMCQGFENPAQDSAKSTAKTRGINAVTKYWSKYGGNYSTSKSYLGFAGYNYPKNLKKGAGITVNGYVASNYKITSVKAQIINSSNKAVYSASASPSAYIYSIKNFDSKLAFSKLGAGTYKYYLYAKDASGKTISIYKTFTVNSSASSQGYTSTTANSGETFTTTVAKTETKKISSARYPSALYYGKGYTIAGKITSSYKLTNVTVSILNSSSKSVLSKSVNPAATSYDIGKIDDYMKFGSLAAGTYYYQVTAKDSYSTKTLLKKKFTVSRYVLSGLRYPTSIKKGAGFTIKGLVKSKFNLTKVTVKIVNAKGTTVSSKTKTLGTVKSYNVYNLDKYLVFKKLAKGTYSYKIVASDGKITKTVLSKTFKVK